MEKILSVIDAEDGTAFGQLLAADCEFRGAGRARVRSALHAGRNSPAQSPVRSIARRGG
jgi:hypothetical protein